MNLLRVARYYYYFDIKIYIHSNRTCRTDINMHIKIHCKDDSILSGKKSREEMISREKYKVVYLFSIYLPYAKLPYQKVE